MHQTPRELSSIPDVVPQSELKTTKSPMSLLADKEITKEPFACNVLWVNCIDNFYISPITQKKNIEEVMKSIQDQNPTKRLTTFDINDVCKIKFNGLYYRTRIENYYPEYSKVDCFFLDLGKKETVSVQSLRQCEEYRHVPALVIQARLAGVKPRLSNWTEKDIKTFKKLVMQVDQPLMLTTVLFDKLWYVRLTLDGQDIGEMLNEDIWRDVDDKSSSSDEESINGDERNRGRKKRTVPTCRNTFEPVSAASLLMESYSEGRARPHRTVSLSPRPNRSPVPLERRSCSFHDKPVTPWDNSGRKIDVPSKRRQRLHDDEETVSVKRARKKRSKSLDDRPVSPGDASLDDTFQYDEETETAEQRRARKKRSKSLDNRRRPVSPGDASLLDDDSLQYDEDDSLQYDEQTEFVNVKGR